MSSYVQLAGNKAVSCLVLTTSFLSNEQVKVPALYWGAGAPSHSTSAIQGYIYGVILILEGLVSGYKAAQQNA